MENSTIKLLRPFIEQALSTLFLSNFFRMEDGSTYSQDEVEWDAKRSTRRIAEPVVGGIDGEYTAVTDNKHDRKKTEAPVYKLKTAVGQSQLRGLQPGQNIYEDPDFLANAIAAIIRNINLLVPMIRRAVELQAAQILQTGEIAITNFTQDYFPKASHFPTATITWDQTGADPEGDLNALCNQINTDAKRPPNTVIFGETAWLEFLANEKIQERFNSRRIKPAEQILSPDRRGGGGYHGTITIGASYEVDLWTYAGEYEDSSNVTHRYIDSNKVIVMITGSRLVATYGRIGRLAPVDARVLEFLPNNLDFGQEELALTLNAWFSKDNESLTVGVAGRPLLIPMEIDAFGCLTT